MIEFFTQPQTHTQQQKTLKMVENDRMAGSVPAWVPVEKGTKAHVETTIENAINQKNDINSNTLLAYTGNQATANNSEEFTFGDLVDMVNPLQHIPVVNHAYRELTGDEIKPIGKIMGGALFGGPIGAASGLVDTVVIEETGKDMGSHVMDTAFNRTEKPSPVMAFAPVEKEVEKEAENTFAAFANLKTEISPTTLEMIKSEPREPITEIRFSGNNGLYSL